MSKPSKPWLNKYSENVRALVLSYCDDPLCDDLFSANNSESYERAMQKLIASRGTEAVTAMRFNLKKAVQQKPNFIN